MRRAALLGAVVAAGCGGASNSSAPPQTSATAAPAQTSTTAAPPSTAAHIQLSSPAFPPGGAIPRVYTCDGRDLPLPLHWSGVPAAARELVLVMRDPDAPGGNFIHWALAGIPATATTVPARAVEGRNSFGSVGYRGPCPPKGDPAHRYVLTLSALAQPTTLSAGFAAASLPTAGLAAGTLTGTYARH